MARLFRGRQSRRSIFAIRLDIKRLGRWRTGPAKGTFRDSMAPPNLHGVLVIDKPIGPTSHDVVARLRKVLDTRAIGHAGTLNPAATGVLVVAIGEATKLSPYLTAQAKEYRAAIHFGTSTATLDAQGEVVATGPIPDELTAELSALASGDPGRTTRGRGTCHRAGSRHRARAPRANPSGVLGHQDEWPRSARAGKARQRCPTRTARR